MCIAAISTAHPEYPFILLSNRDVRHTRFMTAFSTLHKTRH